MLNTLCMTRLSVKNTSAINVGFQLGLGDIIVLATNRDVLKVSYRDI